MLELIFTMFRFWGKYFEIIPSTFQSSLFHVARITHIQIEIPASLQIPEGLAFATYPRGCAI